MIYISLRFYRRETICYKESSQGEFCDAVKIVTADLDFYIATGMFYCFDFERYALVLLINLKIKPVGFYFDTERPSYLPVLQWTYCYYL